MLLISGTCVIESLDLHPRIGGVVAEQRTAAAP
ncbi:MAG: hypothetical protein QOH36_64 [Actinomycetota bacterium]|jgi:hypothetical protein|nr:hypothetical protein [Actinomycetota bacterium]MEA2972472.1 hypothetical protein [Actinomycetota bacterium]